MPGFENGRKSAAKECGQPFEAGKGKNMDYPSESLEWNTVLLTSARSPAGPVTTIRIIRVPFHYFKPLCV